MLTFSARKYKFVANFMDERFIKTSLIETNKIVYYKVHPIQKYDKEFVDDHSLRIWTDWRKVHFVEYTGSFFKKHKNEIVVASIYDYSLIDWSLL